MINSSFKDWEIAREIFGRNTRVECQIIKSLRKHGEIVSSLGDGYSRIKDSSKEICLGYVIPNKYLNL